MHSGLNKRNSVHCIVNLIEKCDFPIGIRIRAKILNRFVEYYNSLKPSKKNTSNKYFPQEWSSKVRPGLLLLKVQLMFPLCVFIIVMTLLSALVSLFYKKHFTLNQDQDYQRKTSKFLQWQARPHIRSDCRELTIPRDLETAKKTYGGWWVVVGVVVYRQTLI